MTYQQTLEYLYQRLPMFTRIGAAAYKKDLHNTLALLHELGNPHQQFTSIHIAGTNGKGSVSHMLAAIFQTHGYKTGLYTSPHLRDFRERIKINGTPVAENFVTTWVQKMQVNLEAIEPSFFEATVAMAFDYFACQQVDIAIIETGLGGRLDSTNVVTPAMSIITNIGWDHMNLLGNTLEKIAGEKAGIIKPGIPVVIGEALAETRPVFEATAKAQNSPIYFAEQEFAFSSLIPGWMDLQLTFKHEEGADICINTDLAGLYQAYNVRTVLCALKYWKHPTLPLQWQKAIEALGHVQARTGLEGRWQVIRQEPFVVLDVAHNQAGMAQLLNQLAVFEELWPGSKIHLIMGMAADKAVEEVLAQLPKHYKYYFTNAQIPRALPASQLQQKAYQQGITGAAFSHVNLALRQALSHCQRQDIIVVCGSVFVVGEVDITITNQTFSITGW